MKKNVVIFRLTFQLHSDVETLLETAVWTSFPLSLVDDTTSLGHTIVHLFVLHSAFKEALARFARQEAVVVTTHFVPTNWATLFNMFFRVGLI